MSGWVQRLGNFYPSLKTLRVVAIVGPVAFAVAVGLVTDFVLQPSLPEHWPYIIATLMVVVGAVAFALFIFSLLEATYTQLQQQKSQLEQQAVELKALTEAERRQTEEWKTLFELGEEVTASPDREGLLQSIVFKAKRLLNTEVAALMLLSPDGSSVYMAAHEGLETAAMRKLRLLSEHGLQGLVLQTGGPVIVNDYASDERLRNRPAALVAEEGLVSLLSVPFPGRDRAAGTLTVGNRHPTAFTERQAELLQAFASWAAVATETSQLYEKLESLALLEERERIGMDLHDGVIQSIYAVGLRLEDCAERVHDRPDDVRADLEGAMEDLNRVIRDIRRYIMDLGADVSQVSDLPLALGELVRDVRVNTLMDAELAVEGDLEGRLDEEKALALYHIAQEALNNVTRHSKASSVLVRLTAEDSSVRLQVEDNGVGFRADESRDREKHGLRNMRDRARSLGANLILESEPGRGTRVMVELPLSSQEG